MRALVISDLHFGAWTTDGLLARPFARERLAPLLDDIDELVLLGDVFDIQFGEMEGAFEEAEPFFELVRDKLQGKRVVFVAGNHDHHLVVGTLRAYSEYRIATGVDDSEAGPRFAREHRNFAELFFERTLEGVEVEMSYPDYRLGRVHLCHGHYLDAHLQGSLANRTLRRVLRRIGGDRAQDAMTIADYEAVVVPLAELMFTVAQMPGGTDAQRGFLDSFERYARVLRAVGIVQREAGRLRAWLSELRKSDEPIADRGRSLTMALQHAGAALREDVADRGESALLQLAQPGSAASAPVALRAYGQVVRNLGWNQPGTSLVFGHTHEPLDGRFEPDCGPVQFWNTGSWTFQPNLASKETYVSYLETSWPGTALRIRDDDVQLVRALDDQNPLHGGRPDPDLRRPDERAAAYEREL